MEPGSTFNLGSIVTIPTHFMASVNYILTKLAQLALVEIDNIDVSVDLYHSSMILWK